MTQQLYESFINRQYSLLIDLHVDDPFARILSKAARIMLIYYDYLDQARKLYIDTMDHYLATVFNRYVEDTNVYADNEIHMRYLNDIKKEIQDLCLLLNEYDKNDSYINEIINVIVTALLTPADKKEPFLSIVLIADDHFCNDLTPYLATDRLKELLKEYTKNYKIRLDTQKTVVKTFNEELKKRDA